MITSQEIHSEDKNRLVFTCGKNYEDYEKIFSKAEREI